VSAPRAKVDILRDYMSAGEWPRALSLAASWPSLGDEKVAIQRGHEACVRPGFQKQLGRNPDALVAEGVAALRRRYGA